MIPVEEIQLKLDDLKQAIAYEVKHRYSNVQGRQKAFSQYVFETLKLLNRWEMGEPGQRAQLLQKFELYGNMDLSSRRQALDLMEGFLGQILGTSSGGEASSRKKTTASVHTVFNKSVDQMEIQYLRGVGPRLAQLLGQVGVVTVENLLYYFPRRYLDYNNRVKIRDLEEGQDVTVIASIQSVSAYQAQNKNISILNLTVADETGQMGISWFYAKSNRAQLESYKSRFSKGSDVMLSGKVKW
ncbi:MAG: hypothetical protein K2X66_17960, partial [Cyanobacteria bacterium]|nr:hypothetical protein [Cyanobacteriota bacterium]